MSTKVIISHYFYFVNKLFTRWRPRILPTEKSTHKTVLYVHETWDLFLVFHFRFPISTRFQGSIAMCDKTGIFLYFRRMKNSKTVSVKLRAVFVRATCLFSCVSTFSNRHFRFAISFQLAKSIDFASSHEMAKRKLEKFTQTRISSTHSGRRKCVTCPKHKNISQVSCT